MKSTNPQCGSYRHRIAFQKLTETRDASGGLVRTYSTEVEVWGSVEELSGIEKLTAAQLKTESTHKIRCRYVPGREPNQLLLINGTERMRIIDLHDTDFLHRDLEILAKQVTS